MVRKFTAKLVLTFNQSNKTIDVVTFVFQLEQTGRLHKEVAKKVRTLRLVVLLEFFRFDVLLLPQSVPLFLPWFSVPPLSHICLHWLAGYKK